MSTIVRASFPIFNTFGCRFIQFFQRVEYHECVTKDDRSARQARAMGINVRQRREAVSLTLGQLAAYAEVGKSWLSRLERGEIEGPSAVALKRVADQLGCTVDDLLREQDPTGEATIDVPYSIADRVRRLVKDLPAEKWAQLELTAGIWVTGQQPTEGDPNKQAGAAEQNQPPPAPP